MMRFITITMVMLMASCASYNPGVSDYAQSADSATTAYAIYAADAIEGNPLIAGLVHEPAGMIAVAGAKLYMVHRFRQASPEICRAGIAGATGSGAAAAANNLAVIAGSGVGMSLFLPAAIILTYISYHSNAVSECGGYSG